MYLARKTKSPLPFEDERGFTAVNEWLFFQMASVGPDVRPGWSPPS